uniref:Uncharacterized protein n=1 Tax=Anguilla anguilla TaxID=7936 RepID=A0A0E9XPU4_ANGAN
MGVHLCLFSYKRRTYHTICST